MFRNRKGWPSGLTETQLQAARRCRSRRHCDVCGEDKEPGKALCMTCYKRLPDDLRSGLHLQMGAGFEESYAEAIEWHQSGKIPE